MGRLAYPHLDEYVVLISLRILRPWTRMSETKVRIQLDLPIREAEALDELRGRMAVRSRAEVVRTALAVVEWMEAETARGRRVVAVGDDTVSYLALPWLGER